MNISQPLTVLIHTQEGDVHADVVTSELRRRGHRVIRYRGDQLPEATTAELRFSNRRSSSIVRAGDGSFALDQVDVVWNRRPTWAKVPACVAPEDHRYVREQNHMLERAINVLAGDAFWINPQRAAGVADVKANQLRLAPACGLRIPDTLISNDPTAIRQFLAERECVIHKPLFGGIWHEAGKLYGSFTARVTAGDLPRDELLQAAPGIFQQQKPKAYEVRAQFFGASCFAVRIDSQRIDYGEYDWRLHQHADAASASIELPDDVYRSCRRLMKQLDLVSGGFDFIVSGDGEWTFLEVNEAGQFLFLEQWRPELTLVDAICSLIESRDADFVYRRPACPVRLEDLCQEVEPTLLAVEARGGFVSPEPVPEARADTAAG